MRVAGRTPTGWLPPGRSAAVCLSIDDIHPGRSGDHYEAGGDLERRRARAASSACSTATPNCA